MFGQNIGLETLEKEFKEFGFYNEVPENLIKKLARSNIIDKKTIDEFIKHIDKNLELNFMKIVPKYLASFTNSNVKGELFIGVNDDGKCLGIPHTNLTIDKIKKMLQSCEKYVDCNLDDIEISLTKLKINNIQERYNDFKRMMKKIIDKNIFELSKYNDYMNKRTKSLNKINKYRCKIFKVVKNNRLRNECRNFILKECNDMKIIDRLLIDLESLKTEYSMLENQDLIHQLKYDKTNIIYWILEFRDFFTSYHVKRTIKQSFNLKLLFGSPYKYIYKSMQLFAPILMRINKMHFYVIKLTFNCTKNNEVKFKNVFSNDNPDEWKLSFRTLGNNNQPVTQYI